MSGRNGEMACPFSSLVCHGERSFVVMLQIVCVKLPLCSGNLGEMKSITLELVSWKLRRKNNVIVMGVYGSRGV